MAGLLPRIAVSLPAAGTGLAPAALFDFPIREAWLEIGFGGGEHLAVQAADHPDVGMIGCEPYVNGIASLLAQVDDRGLRNVRIRCGDARDLLDALEEASLDRVFILFPDPWPKVRHHRRRLVGTETLAALARVMKDGAELRLATDHTDYGRWMLAHIGRHPAFRWTAQAPADWKERSDDWPATRYEAKAKARGEVCLYLRYRRVSRK